MDSPMISFKTTKTIREYLAENASSVIATLEEVARIPHQSVPIKYRKAISFARNTLYNSQDSELMHFVHDCDAFERNNRKKVAKKK